VEEVGVFAEELLAEAAHVLTEERGEGEFAVVGFELVGEDGVGIAEVADQLGYPDQESFTRQFTRVLGLPPSRWRTAHHGDAG
jgi:AraC-like DNA-binding protein